MQGTVSGPLPEKMTSYRFPENVFVLYRVKIKVKVIAEIRFRSNVHSGKCTRGTTNSAVVNWGA